MKKICFKIKYDKEFSDYYFTPFKNGEYVWINDIMESNAGLVAKTEYGFIKVLEINWKDSKVICEI